MRLAVLVGGAATLLAGILVAGPDPRYAQATTITFSGSMEGSMSFPPGSWMAAGYYVKIDGNHPAASITLASATVSLPVACSNNGPTAGTIVVPLSPGPVLIPANDNTRFPEDEPTHPDSFQGAVQAPNFCAGGLLHTDIHQTAVDTREATFSAGVQSSPAPLTLKLQFHYRIPAGKNQANINCDDPVSNPPDGFDACGASNSSTQTIITSGMTPTHTPTNAPTDTPTDTPATPNTATTTTPTSRIEPSSTPRVQQPMNTPTRASAVLPNVAGPPPPPRLFVKSLPSTGTGGHAEPADAPALALVAGLILCMSLIGAPVMAQRISRARWRD